jgi:hypothetical protein
MMHRGISNPKALNPDELPEPFNTIMHTVAERDRLWFEAHPGESVYEREHVEGEFYPYVPKGSIVGVMVTLVEQSVRSRAPLEVLGSRRERRARGGARQQICIVVLDFDGPRTAQRLTN